MQCTSIRPVLRYGMVLYLIRTALSDTIRSTYTEGDISHRLYGRILSRTLTEALFLPASRITRDLKGLALLGVPGMYRKGTFFKIKTNRTLLFCKLTIVEGASGATLPFKDSD